MIKVLHISDVHLDRPFGGRKPRVTGLLNQAIRTAFSRATSFCIEQEMDALLIAGDLFDGETVEPGTALFLKQELDRLAAFNIKVVYATGNHDCARRIRHLSFFTWPENVHIAWTPEPTVFHLTSKTGLPFAVVTCGHGTSGESENVVARFPRKEQVLAMSPVTDLSNQVVIGMAHSWITSLTAEDKGKYLPCSLEDIVRLGYDYFALGHIHQQITYLEGRAAYAGSLQSVSRDELGLKGGLKVELDRGAVHTEKIPLAGVTFFEMALAVDEAATLDDVGQIIVAAMNEEACKVGVSLSESIVRVRLRGRSPIKSMLGQSAVKEALIESLLQATSAVEIEVETDQVLPLVKAADYETTDTFLGHLLRITGDEAALNPIVDEMMTNLKLSTHFGDEAETRAWVKMLLSESSENLVELLTKPEGGAPS